MSKRLILAGMMSLTTGVGYGIVHAGVIPVNPTAQGRAVDTSGDGNGDTTMGTMWAGDYESNGDNTNWLQRGIITFALPNIPAGQTIQSAELHIFYSGRAGTPDGNAVLYHLRDVNNTTVVEGDYGATPATLINGWSVTPAESASKYHNVDVTAVIQADYANDPTGQKVAVFRVEVPDQAYPKGTNGNGTTDRYLFENSGNPNFLKITTVPEPAAMSLLGLGGLLMLRHRRR